jgi:hypothetical protein
MHMCSSPAQEVWWIAAGYPDRLFMINELFLHTETHKTFQYLNHFVRSMKDDYGRHQFPAQWVRCRQAEIFGGSIAIGFPSSRTDYIY